MIDPTLAARLLARSVEIRDQVAGARQAAEMLPLFLARQFLDQIAEAEKTADLIVEAAAALTELIAPRETPPFPPSSPS